MKSRSINIDTVNKVQNIETADSCDLNRCLCRFHFTKCAREKKEETQSWREHGRRVSESVCIDAFDKTEAFLIDETSKTFSMWISWSIITYLYHWLLCDDCVRSADCSHMIWSEMLLLYLSVRLILNDSINDLSLMFWWKQTQVFCSGYLILEED